MNACSPGRKSALEHYAFTFCSLGNSDIVDEETEFLLFYGRYFFPFSYLVIFKPKSPARPVY
jgi:hypothetical protein